MAYGTREKHGEKGKKGRGYPEGGYREPEKKVIRIYNQVEKIKGFPRLNICSYTIYLYY